MPNGDYVWREEQLPKVKTFFKKISAVLDQFAHDHNLRIEKYYHDIPGWEFLFRHPLRGVCYIEILMKDEGHVTVCADWWVDVYESGKRSDKHTEREIWPLDEDELYAKLKTVLSIVLSWKKEDLIEGHGGHAEWQKACSAEEFEHIYDEYPFPKLD